VNGKTICLPIIVDHFKRCENLSFHFLYEDKNNNIISDRYYHLPKLTHLTLPCGFDGSCDDDDEEEEEDDDDDENDDDDGGEAIIAEE